MWGGGWGVGGSFSGLETPCLGCEVRETWLSPARPYLSPFHSLPSTSRVSSHPHRHDGVLLFLHNEHLLVLKVLLAPGPQCRIAECHHSELNHHIVLCTLLCVSVCFSVWNSMCLCVYALVSMCHLCLCVHVYVVVGLSICMCAVCLDDPVPCKHMCCLGK